MAPCCIKLVVYNRGASPDSATEADWRENASRENLSIVSVILTFSRMIKRVVFRHLYKIQTQKS